MAKRICVTFSDFNTKGLKEYANYYGLKFTQSVNMLITQGLEVEKVRMAELEAKLNPGGEK